MIDSMASESTQPDDDEFLVEKTPDDERDPDSLPTSSDPSGTCPRCRRTSNFVTEKLFPLQTGNSVRLAQQVVVLKCQGCLSCSIAIEEHRTVPLGGNMMTSRWVPLYWWPTPGAAVDLHDVPGDVASAYEEGVRCVSVEAPHAAVAMFRNALAQIVQNKGSEAAKEARTLDAAIKQMTKDRDLYGMFEQWATQIRTWGNAGAHQEAYEPVTLEDAKELQNLTLAMIKYLYIEPANLDRLQQVTRRNKS